MVWLPDGENYFEDMFIRFDRIRERDRHTDGRTQHDDIGRACIASRGKKLIAGSHVTLNFKQHLYCKTA